MYKSNSTPSNIYTPGSCVSTGTISSSHFPQLRKVFISFLLSHVISELSLWQAQCYFCLPKPYLSTQQQRLVMGNLVVTFSYQLLTRNSSVPSHSEMSKIFCPDIQIAVHHMFPFSWDWNWQLFLTLPLLLAPPHLSHIIVASFDPWVLVSLK